ncbi:hypothetical protein BX286_2441 [Streptomyces sp. 3211.6]|uniref:hypothetical protein n=1 Tax=Streptomyces sp. 3211.6 TaxID=1938845 RepID=UPI000F15348F|nr:hypothetical protein [Streptomyces sp. 3211.6]RKT04487.1 hypothetical protein BX286_2441 [Streptomyces sp. 3211.6]
MPTAARQEVNRPEASEPLAHECGVCRALDADLTVAEAVGNLGAVESLRNELRNHSRDGGAA